MAHDPAIPRPAINASRHRRWRVWYDSGVLYNGSCVVETAWYAKGPRTDIIQAREFSHVLAAIDEIEDALGNTDGDRLPYDPPANGADFTFWQADLRGRQATPESDQ